MYLLYLFLRPVSPTNNTQQFLDSNATRPAFSQKLNNVWEGGGITDSNRTMKIMQQMDNWFKYE
jgi:hypothetical protein